MAEAILPRLHEHFAAGTFGAVKASQVRISRKAWRPPNSKGNFHVYLEIDEEAFNWLRTRQWMSSIGLFVTRWQHPPVKGLTGQIDPDADIKLLRSRLAQEANQGSSSVDTTLVPEDITTVQDTRSRHITGEDNETQSKGDIPQAEEDILLGEEDFGENNVFHTKLSAEQKEELLKVTAIPPAASTPVRRSRSELSPPGTPSRKQHRRTKQDGTGQSDRSDTDP